MPYPATVSNTDVWPAFKNCQVGAYSATVRIAAVEQLTHNSTSEVGRFTTGGPTSTWFDAQSFTLDADIINPRVDLMLFKTGSPADNFIVEIQADDGAGNPSGVALASVTLAGTDPLWVLASATGHWHQFNFTYTLLANTPYWIVCYRSGAAAVGAYYNWRGTGIAGLGYNGGYRAYKGQTGSWTQRPTEDKAFRVCKPETRLESVVFLPSSTAVDAWKSIDLGLTWSLIPAPSVALVFSNDVPERNSIDVGVEGTQLSVGYIQGSINFKVRSWDMEVMAWGKSDAGTGAGGTKNLSVSAASPLQIEFRSTDSALFSSFQAAVEAARRRIGITRRIAIGGWDTQMDIITGTAALPGTAIDYDLQWSVEGSSGRLHFFWTQSDTASLYTRILNSDNTWGAITAIPGTALSNTAKYAVGYGCTYMDGGNTYIAIPYYDTTALGVNVARCESSAAGTGGNWTVTTAISGVAETDLSNPAALSSDGGKKLLLWAVDVTTRKLKYANDGGVNAWTSPVDWKPTQSYSVIALSQRLSADRCGLVYYDDFPTLDRVKYDQVVVFF